MRDGEQTQGVSFTPPEKANIAKTLLKKLRVDRIEVTSARISSGELGSVQNITAWAEEKLYQLIVHRYNSVLPTVITSRVLLSDPDQDDRESRASFSASIMSRLRDGLMVSERLLEAPDYRNRGSAKPPARRTRTERGRGRR